MQQQKLPLHSKIKVPAKKTANCIVLINSSVFPDLSLISTLIDIKKLQDANIDCKVLLLERGQSINHHRSFRSSNARKLIAQVITYVSKKILHMKNLPVTSDLSINLQSNNFWSFVLNTAHVLSTSEFDNFHYYGNTKDGPFAKKLQCMLVIFNIMILKPDMVYLASHFKPLEKMISVFLPNTKILYSPDTFHLENRNQHAPQSSIPSNCYINTDHILISTSKADLEKKINRAYCPEKEIALSPIFALISQIIFPMQQKIDILRPAKYGGNLTNLTYEELIRHYNEGSIHSQDLKVAVYKALWQLLKKIQSIEKNLYIKRSLNTLKKELTFVT